MQALERLTAMPVRRDLIRSADLATRCCSFVHEANLLFRGALCVALEITDSQHHSGNAYDSQPGGYRFRTHNHSFLLSASSDRTGLINSKPR